jgi:hypothetical protein
MHSNVIVVAQPRSGGVVSTQVLNRIYPSHNNLNEHFNCHRFGYNINDQLISAHAQQPFIVKVSYFDLKDVFNELVKFDADWYHVTRTNPVEMVCSSYLSSISGIFHLDKNELHTPLTNVTIPKDFVEWFFSKDNPGGWHYNLDINIPFLDNINYKKIKYNDLITPSKIYMQLTGNKRKIKLGIQKLYPNKDITIKNLKEVIGWVTDYV